MPRTERQIKLLRPFYKRNENRCKTQLFYILNWNIRYFCNWFTEKFIRLYPYRMACGFLLWIQCNHRWFFFLYSICRNGFGQFHAKTKKKLNKNYTEQNVYIENIVFDLWFFAKENFCCSDSKQLTTFVGKKAPSRIKGNELFSFFTNSIK